MDGPNFVGLRRLVSCRGIFETTATNCLEWGPTVLGHFEVPLLPHWGRPANCDLRPVKERGLGDIQGVCL